MAQVDNTQQTGDGFFLTRHAHHITFLRVRESGTRCDWVQYHLSDVLPPDKNISTYRIKDGARFAAKAPNVLNEPTQKFELVQLSEAIELELIAMSKVAA